MLEPPVVKRDYGPVITISRDFGCGGTGFACSLKDRINKYNKFKKNAEEWNVISKEILEKSANELHSSQHMISHLFDSETRGFYAEIIESFSGKYYVSDARIKNTINKVIKGYGEEGNVIIVGRAGFIFTQHIDRSLHIKLTAPFGWRVNKIAERFGITNNEAKQRVLELDDKRKKFLQFFNPVIDDRECFDVVFNLKNFSKDEIIETLIMMIEAKKII